MIVGEKYFFFPLGKIKFRCPVCSQINKQAKMSEFKDAINARPHADEQLLLHAVVHEIITIYRKVPLGDARRELLAIQSRETLIYHCTIY